MDHILNIETSTNVCSVSISQGSNIIALEESKVDRSHAALLTILIGEALKESGKSFGDLSAVSVSKGPGSYTGLRIGVSTAKGICYGADLPLIAIDTMNIMALKLLTLAGDNGSNAPYTPGIEITAPSQQGSYRDLLQNGDKVLLCPMIDARRMEVYTALFDSGGKQVKEVTAEIIDETGFAGLLEEYKILFFGDGAGKCQEKIKHPNAIFVSGIYPSAGNMALLSGMAYAEKKFVDTAYFEPFYLKDFLATTPRNKMG